MEFSSTIFSGRKLLYKGYIYIKDKDSIDSTYWRCEKRDSCNGRITTHRVSGCIKKPPSTHTHSPDSAAIEAVKTIGDIKLRSTLTEEATSSIIQNSTKYISIPAAVKLPSKNSLSKSCGVRGELQMMILSSRCILQEDNNF